MQQEDKSSDQQMIDKLDQIVKLLESQYKLSEKTLFKSFVHGLLVAFGATVGLTVTFAVLSAVLRMLGAFPLVGNWFIELGNYLHK
jgi:hypothetical protein